MREVCSAGTKLVSCFLMHQITSSRYAATIATSTVEATAYLQAQYMYVKLAALVLCCLDGKKVVGSDDTCTSVLETSGS